MEWGNKIWLLSFWRFLKYFVASILLILVSLGVLCFVLPKISIAKTDTSTKGEYKIYLLNTGVHTDFVVPIKSEVMDWKTYFPFANNKVVDTTFKYLAIGWGNKEFYLNAPTWGDLTAMMAIKAATGLGQGAIHATFRYAQPPYKNEDTQKDMQFATLMLSENAYKKLCKYILATLKFNHQKKTIVLLSQKKGVNADYDRYYDAKWTFSIFHSCNTWVNNGLKASEQKACYWAGLPDGLFSLYEK